MSDGFIKYSALAAFFRITEDEMRNWLATGHRPGPPSRAGPQQRASTGGSGGPRLGSLYRCGRLRLLSHFYGDTPKMAKQRKVSAPGRTGSRTLQALASPNCSKPSSQA